MRRLFNSSLLGSLLSLLLLGGCDGDKSKPENADTHEESDLSRDQVDEGETPLLDSDEDGLSDLLELEIGSVPFKVDTDGDGYWDGWEYHAGSDPLNPLSLPPLPELKGRHYQATITKVSEPAALNLVFSRLFKEWPPLGLLLQAADEPQDDGEMPLKIQGGLIEARPMIEGHDGHDGEAQEERYAMKFKALDPKDGSFRVELFGSQKEDKVLAQADALLFDLSGWNDFMPNLLLPLHDVTLSAELEAPFEAAPKLKGQFRGKITRDQLESIFNDSNLPFPIDFEVVMAALDPEETGEVMLTLDFTAETREIDGFVFPSGQAPPPLRPEMTCCPEGIQAGDKIEPWLAKGQQGLDPAEEEKAMRVIAHVLTQRDKLDFVATQRTIEGERRIYVYSPRGHIYFRVDWDNEDPNKLAFKTFLLPDLNALEGTEIPMEDERNPLAKQDPKTLSSLQKFCNHGVPFLNRPDSTPPCALLKLPLSFQSYPFAYERLLAAFDEPRAGDLILEPVSYLASQTGSPKASHGQLSALQSRSPLVLSGKGIVNTKGDGLESFCPAPCKEGTAHYLLTSAPARAVDLAPTILQASEAEKHPGVGPGRRFGLKNYLSWQDGEPLSFALNGQKPSYVVLLTHDGLSSMEFLHQMLDEGSEALDAYQELMARGLTFKHGVIANFPSNTFASHNTLSSGAWSGHHGLIDNDFYDREEKAVKSPSKESLYTEKYFGSAHESLPVETLYGAFARSFGGLWDAETNSSGIVTGSINSPASFGAWFASFENRVQDPMVMPKNVSSLKLGEKDWPFPNADKTDQKTLLDNAALLSFWTLYIQNPKDGIPIPRYTAINFLSTDSDGHAHGPHSELIREESLPLSNKRVRILIEILKEAGIYDDTLIVFTSDHAMELKDPALRDELLEGIQDEVPLVRTRNAVYLLEDEAP